MSYHISEDSTIEDMCHIEDALNDLVGYVQYYKYETQHDGKPEELTPEWIAQARQLIQEGKIILEELAQELDTL